MSSIPDFDFLASAQRTIATEHQAIQALQPDAAFVRSCKLLLRCRGKIIVSGMGKSGHIARKIAATLASTGAHAFFMHPGEASHGDLGVVRDDDAVILLSYSGDNNELVLLLPLFKRLAVPIIAFTGRADSTLAQQADAHLLISVQQEACPLNLAPTASTTAMLVMGDALAIALLEARGFTREDFALSHPGGQLGRRLLFQVGDLMHQGVDLPRVSADTVITTALLEMTAKRLGMTCVVDHVGKLVGVYTDGDLRRTIDGGADLQRTCIKQVMTNGCITLAATALAMEAIPLMEKHKIHAVVSVDSAQRPIGVLSMHDLLHAKIV